MINTVLSVCWGKWRQVTYPCCHLTQHPFTSIFFFWSDRNRYATLQTYHVLVQKMWQNCDIKKGRSGRGARWWGSSGSSLFISSLKQITSCETTARLALAPHHPPSPANLGSSVCRRISAPRHPDWTSRYPLLANRKWHRSVLYEHPDIERYSRQPPPDRPTRHFKFPLLLFFLCRDCICCLATIA